MPKVTQNESTEALIQTWSLPEPRHTVTLPLQAQLDLAKLATWNNATLPVATENSLMFIKSTRCLSKYDTLMSISSPALILVLQGQSYRQANAAKLTWAVITEQQPFSGAIWAALPQV